MIGVDERHFYCPELAKVFVAQSSLLGRCKGVVLEHHLVQQPWLDMRGVCRRWAVESIPVDRA